MPGPASLQRGESMSFPLIAEVLGLSLHYGCFDPAAEISPSLRTLAEGQVRFLRAVLELVPADTRSLLDVGTGTGDVAQALAERGIRVTTISPDANQGRWVAARLGPNLRFEQRRFEDFRTDEPLDCVLFSESSNYVDIDSIFTRSTALLRPRGALVVAAPFVLRPCANFADMHRLEDFEHKAREHGWVVEHSTDRTAETAPTLQIGAALLERHAQPAARLLLGSLASAPLRVRLLGWILAPQIRSWTSLLMTTLPERLDAEVFRRDVRFMFLRLRRPDVEAAR